MSQTPPALRQSSHPEPPCLATAGPRRKAEPFGPENLTVKSIFLQLTFSSPEEWLFDDLSIVPWPRGLNGWHLCGVMAAVMKDSEYCVWEHWAVVVMEVMAAVRRNVSEAMTFLWSSLFFSSLLSSFTPPISSALPGGALVLMRRSEGRCMTGWCLLLRSCLTRLRNTHWTSCWSRGRSWSAGTKSLSGRWLQYIHSWTLSFSKSTG